MRTNKISLGILLLAVFAGDVSSQLKNKAGTSGFQFLKIGVGARETALGEVGTIYAEGPTSVFWNVAGLTSGDKISATFFTNSWIASINHNFVGIRIPWADDNYLGMGITYLSMDDMEETTIDNPQGTGRMFGAGDLAVSLAFARRISERFSAGVAVKYVHEYIWDMTAGGWVVDMGLHYTHNRLHLGMAFKDFGLNKEISGPQLEVDDQVYDDWSTSPVLVQLVPNTIRMPMSFHFGAGYDMYSDGVHEIRAMGNVIYFNDIGETQALGIEYIFLDSYSARFGYRFNRDLFTISGGVGARLALGGTLFEADFSVLAMGDFGYRTQVGVGVSF